MNNYSFRPSGFQVLPSVVKNLLIINGIFFLATVVFKSSLGVDLTRFLGLFLPGSAHFSPIQLITHMFMHANLAHIFFNMFALWMFGSPMENIWGPQRFLKYYLITGFGAAALHLGVNYMEMLMLRSDLLDMGASAEMLNSIMKAKNVDEANALLRNLPNTVDNNLIAQYFYKFQIPTVGASGAVFGVLLAFGMTFPDTRIYLYFAIPIKAKYFVIGYGLLELYSGLQNDPTSNVAHFAHLGGMIFGYFLIKYWRKNDRNYYSY